MSRLYIFDLDGTIADTIEDLADSMNQALLSNGYKTHDITAYKRYVGNGMFNLAKRSLGNIEDVNIISRINSEFQMHYENRYLNKTKPYSGILEVFLYLKDNGFKTAVLSNKKDEFTKKICDKLFSGCFDYVAGQTEGIPKKPDPDPVNIIVKRLNAKKENTVLIGDSDIDIITSKNAGIKSIGVTWGYRSKEDLVNAGAKILADNPNELLKIIKENKIGL